ncbi:MAG: WYL domain-containing protein, partial [Pseudomonadota bacterium]
ILPLAITYYVRVAVLAAWCELRSDFRHFRIDRIANCDLLQDTFLGTGAKLRAGLQNLSDEQS